MAHTVFISHSVKDKDQKAADAIYDFLQSNGIGCFMDKRDLTPGATYHTQLATALRESRLVILVFSSNADDSEAVGNEIAIAKNNKIPIIPLRIEDTLPHGLEFFISTPQWLDAFPPPIEAHLPRLREAIRILLGSEPGEDQSPLEPGAGARPPIQESPTGVTPSFDWVDIDSPPEWITDDRKLLKALNDGKVLRGKHFLYRYNQRTRRYQKKLK
jgi:hypothetical protein